MALEIDCVLKVGQFLCHLGRVVRKLQTQHSVPLVGLNSRDINLFQTRCSQHPTRKIENLIQRLLPIKFINRWTMHHSFHSY